MLNNPAIQPKTSASRHYLTVMAFAVVAIVVALGIYFSNSQNEVVSEPVQEVVTATTSESVAFARSAPSRLRVPAIELETTFEAPLGLNDDQTIEVPDSYTEVGWYKLGPTPGEIGPAVILGHVDSYEGPAIFYDIRDLKEGDEIFVDREDGTTAVFEVVKKEQYSQNNFPTELVYGPTLGAELRLITCIGIYSHGTQRYSHNLVVYAKLKE